ncbi:pentapeptide repeat-containing protein [Nodularia chucula]|uniref:pentapeptide repeat-containing protein n=1 Tax=Nodularia chucula TaxID=3093667 RepID=UPI0039C60007
MALAKDNNFSGQNLQGYDFRRKNLTGANFGNADIRGANFSDAILENANFQNAKAGIPQKHITLYLMGMFILFGVSGGASALASVNLTTLFYSDYIRQFTIVPGVVSLFAILLFFAIIIQRGFGGDLAIATGILTGLVATTLWGYLWLVFGSSGTAIANQTGWSLLGAAAWEFVGFTLGTVIFVAAKLLFRSNSYIFWIGWIIGAYLSFNASRSLKHTLVSSDEFWIPNLIVIIFFVFICGYISWQVTASNTKFIYIYNLAVNFCAIGGTSFRKANLTGANFTHTTLTSTDFSDAKLIHTNFYLANKIHQTKTKNTILINHLVRELTVTHNGVDKSYQGCNFKGAYLAFANLQNADFTEADVSLSNLTGANLEFANFTKTQALNTNFEQAKLTGSCLNNWNIDSTTQLDGVICDYVYLCNHQQERRPCSGYFLPGDFTKLFQVAINTVDLIFRNGLDLQALSTALANVKLENIDIPLAIKSIENKGDGVVVVRVDTPEFINKEKIHADFYEHYQFALQQIEARHQAELKSKDEQIRLYSQNQADLKELMQMIAPIVEKKKKQSTLGKLVVLKLGQGNINTGFPVILQISSNGEHPYFESNGQLPPAPELAVAYTQWQISYRHSLQGNLRIKFPQTQVTNISKRDLFKECDRLSFNLHEQVNLWLNSSQFRPLKEQLLEKLNPDESIRILLQTEDNQLRRIPLLLWNFFERYSQAEIALSSNYYERKSKFQSPKSHVKILAILGDSTGINIQKDRVLLEQLPNIEVKFLVEPQRQVLNDELWLQEWDILFFAGHSFTESDAGIGYFHINPRDSLTITELKNALTKAIANGLHLAIFNSCDGLGLATNLADLHIPQMIVMREPVPDKVAQEFLRNFLAEFSTGQPLYQSVREARMKLQGLENDFPCASWLPVIYQNPAESPLELYSYSHQD